MDTDQTLKIGIICYPSVGGSGIVATSLGTELAKRGHEVHFISYERPCRLYLDMPHTHFHPVMINDYSLFKYPDYILPLSVKIAEVSCSQRLDILHVHYAVPHATAAILARSMLPLIKQPRLVTTLHGTDITLIAKDPGYGPAIRHSLLHSDAVTTVSEYLKAETDRFLGFESTIEIIPNFFEPTKPSKSKEDMRRLLYLNDDEIMILHSSNLREIKRIDLLLETVSRLRPKKLFKLVILAGNSFKPFKKQVHQLGLQDRIIVKENVHEIDNYLQAADISLFTSETESFCLGILEAMFYACPCVAFAVGGIPEIVEDGVSGMLIPSGDVDKLAVAVQFLIQNPVFRKSLGAAAKVQAERRLSAKVIVPRYEAIYRLILHRDAQR
ncbi:TPA: N-acetyl-alpha-D-glucosaminyl L-malate synthase BshA [Legionella pneumophila]|nr:N-acetyl-alpha-D-glucosaminyl L-malate synthase BshA [Legionella pneumophila]HDV5806621.1 N-acetyl-alpha-D-glucosaminyl L-malate synthase BshA [Legionella pneumophila]